MPARSDEAAAGRDFYAGVDPGLDVSFFAAVWHVVSLGHLVSNDLDRIARRHDLSIADLLLLGTLRTSCTALRPTDLAHKLHVSSAALTTRITRLAQRRLVVRQPLAADRRGFEVTLTTAGARRADKAISEISRLGRFANRFASLSAGDRASAERILGLLHDLIDRDFISQPRQPLDP
jgi:DNA-binding MarR family transcriptional regulator